MESRALGKGLSALIPERAVDEKSGLVTFLETSEIQDSAFQPRVNYNEEKLAELKASIKEKGVLQPILVRQKGSGFEVVAGERRLKAARALNLEKVPVIVKDVSDQEALVIALVENIQREELNPIEEAEAYRKLIEDFDFSQDVLARSVGKDRSTVSNMLRLLKLPTHIQKSVSAGELSMGHARALVGIDIEAERERLFHLTRKKGLSVRELENLIQSGTGGGARRERRVQEKRQEFVALEEAVQKRLGTKVRIFPQKKRGKIVIEYYSLEDLDRILRLIK